MYQIHYKWPEQANELTWYLRITSAVSQALGLVANVAVDVLPKFGVTYQFAMVSVICIRAARIFLDLMKDMGEIKDKQSKDKQSEEVKVQLPAELEAG